MGLLDKLTGTRRPDPGVERRSPEEVRAALLAVGGPEAPFRIAPGGPDGADLTAEWRIDEPTWQTRFAQRDVRRVVQVMMRLDAEAGEVRSVDRASTVTWRSGVAHLAAEKKMERGQKRHVSFRGELGPEGFELTWSFDDDELKRPLREAALQAGWGWKGITFGKL